MKKVLDLCIIRLKYAWYGVRYGFLGVDIRDYPRLYDENVTLKAALEREVETNLYLSGENEKLERRADSDSGRITALQCIIYKLQREAKESDERIDVISQMIDERIDDIQQMKKEGLGGLAV